MSLHAPGDRVLCLRGGFGDFSDSSPVRIAICPNIPRRGGIYHVRELHSELTMRLCEIVNPVNSGGTEPVFYQDRFVPVKRVETDISVFHRIRLRQERARSRTVRPRKKEKA